MPDRYASHSVITCQLYRLTTPQECGGSLCRDFSDTRVFQHVDGCFTCNLILIQPFNQLCKEILKAVETAADFLPVSKARGFRLVFRWNEGPKECPPGKWPFGYAVPEGSRRAGHRAGGCNRRESFHYTGIARFGLMNVLHFHSWQLPWRMEQPAHA